jgi:hypothetical protein
MSLVCQEQIDAFVFGGNPNSQIGKVLFNVVANDLFASMDCEKWSHSGVQLQGNVSSRSFGAGATNCLGHAEA